MNKKEHWENVFKTKSLKEVSWYGREFTKITTQNETYFLFGVNNGTLQSFKLNNEGKLKKI